MFRVVNKNYALYAECKIEVYNYVIANRINKYLNYYNDYRFSKNAMEEPVFKFEKHQENQILKLLKGV